MKKTLLLLALTASLLIGGGGAEAEAGEGSLDLGFGRDGRVIQPFGAGEGLEAALLGQGRVFATGRGKALALLPSGQVDRGFGEAGFISLVRPQGGLDAGIGTMLLDPQGRLLLIGNCTFPTEANNLGFYSLAIVERYTADGRLDPSFGKGGIALVDPGLRAEPPGSPPQVVPSTAALDSKGRIVFGGSNYGVRPYKGSFISYSEPFVARLTAQGEVDRSFADDGVLPVRATEQVESIAPDATGGAYLSATKEPRRVLFHLGDDGAVDRSFGEDGFRMQPRDAVNGPVLQDSSGRLLIFRYLSDWPSHHLAGGVQIKRLLPNGKLDRSFGRNGEARVRVPQFDTYRLQVDGEGRILIAADLKAGNPIGRLPGAPAALALVRLLPDGGLDPGFGRDGVFRIPYREGWQLQIQTLDVVGDEALLGALWYGRGESHSGRTLVRVRLGA